MNTYLLMDNMGHGDIREGETAHRTWINWVLEPRGVEHPDTMVSREQILAKGFTTMRKVEGERCVIYLLEKKGDK